MSLQEISHEYVVLLKHLHQQPGATRSNTNEVSVYRLIDLDFLVVFH